MPKIFNLFIHTNSLQNLHFLEILLVPKIFSMDANSSRRFYSKERGATIELIFIRLKSNQILLKITTLSIIGFSKLHSAYASSVIILKPTRWVSHFYIVMPSLIMLSNAQCHIFILVCWVLLWWVSWLRQWVFQGLYYRTLRTRNLQNYGQIS